MCPHFYSHSIFAILHFACAFACILFPCYSQLTFVLFSSYVRRIPVRRSFYFHSTLILLPSTCPSQCRSTLVLSSVYPHCDSMLSPLYFHCAPCYFHFTFGLLPLCSHFTSTPCPVHFPFYFHFNYIFSFLSDYPFYLHVISISFSTHLHFIFHTIPIASPFCFRCTRTPPAFHAHAIPTVPSCYVHFIFTLPPSYVRFSTPIATCRLSARHPHA